MIIQKSGHDSNPRVGSTFAPKIIVRMIAVFCRVLTQTCPVAFSVLLIGIPWIHAPVQAGDSLVLVSGETVTGTPIPWENAETLRWQGDAFMDPFEFRIETIQSIVFAKEADVSVSVQDISDALMFELINGDFVVGQLVSWENELVRIQSLTVGEVQVHPTELRRITRASTEVDHQEVEEVRSGPIYKSGRIYQDGRWPNLSDPLGDDQNARWRETDGGYATDVPGAVLEGSKGIPDRAVVDLDLSWSQFPDFAFALGVGMSDPSESGQDALDEQVAGEPQWRLETAGDFLFMVVERGETVDVRRLISLGDLSRVRLLIYLDLNEQRMEVLSEQGVSLGVVQLPKNAPAFSGSNVPTKRAGNEEEANNSHGVVRLENRGESLKVDRLQVSNWVGGIPERLGTGEVSLALDDGSVLSGRVAEVVGSKSGLRIATASGEVTVEISKLSEARFSPESSEVASGQCRLFLRDGSCISGRLGIVSDEAWRVEPSVGVGEISVPRSTLLSINVLQNDPADVQEVPVLGRIGRLQVGPDLISGRLISDSRPPKPDAFALAWHPLRSRTAARIRRDCVGAILFRDPMTMKREGAAAKLLEQQKARNQQLRRGLNFGELFLQRTDLSKLAPVNQDAHVLHLRSGDTMPCRVESFGVDGLRVSTEFDGVRVIPNAQVKAVEFVSNSPPPNVEEAKRQRLLTIPRLQKSEPPSHLLCSHNGDFLRCSVVDSRGDFLIVEIQSNQIPVARERIAQVIWFHPEELASESKSGKKIQAGDPIRRGVDKSDRFDFEGYVQVVQNDGKRVTMTPLELNEEWLVGKSPWIGDCKFDLGRLDQLLFGKRIELDVVDVAYNQWKLSAAVEPLVASVMKGKGAEGGSSAMIGQVIPASRMELLDGTQVSPEHYRGNWLMLDFWASWSAASVKTLPLLDAVATELPVEGLQRVSINLEEGRDHVVAFQNRKPISASIALDSDGVLAELYEISVLPQVVIVDPDGKVAGVYFGGGEVMTQAILNDFLERATDDAAKP